jgi:acetate kinase
LQGNAAAIAELLHDLERHLMAKNDKAALAKVARLHRIAGDIATKHGAALGVDVVAFSGGPLKPPADD